MYEELKYSYLKSHPLFTDMNGETILSASSIVKVRTVYRGETLNYGDGEYSKVFLLVTGKIKITESDERGSELIKDILAAPDVFGDLGLDGNPCLDEFAEALVPNTIVCIISSRDFKKLLAENPVLGLKYVSMVNNKMRRLEVRHSDLVFHDAKDRLIRFIRDWARSDGDRVGNRIVLNNYLTHNDIARVIAVSRQNVNTFLNELRKSGLLFYNRDKIELIDPSSWN
jgi:CRP/FNR family cyclic AMP-dependent transcriptional regulator